jgi:hypothetical protein
MKSDQNSKCLSEIRNEYLPNTSLDRYRYNSLVGIIVILRYIAAINLFTIHLHILSMLGSKPNNVHPIYLLYNPHIKHCFVNSYNTMIASGYWHIQIRMQFRILGSHSCEFERYYPLGCVYFGRSAAKFLSRLPSASCLTYYSALKMGAICSSETSGDFYRTTRHHILEHFSEFHLNTTHICLCELSVCVSVTAPEIPS